MHVVNEDMTKLWWTQFVLSCKDRIHIWRNSTRKQLQPG